MGDVDPVDHQVGEEAAAEVPEPAPVTKAVLVEGLRARRRGTPSSRPLRIDAQRRSCGTRSAVAVPGQVDLDDLAEPAGLDQLAGLLNVRHAALLRADLDDLLVCGPGRR